MTRQQIFSIVFFSLLVLLIYQIGLMFRPFLFSALWAGLLAHWAFPLHVRLTRLFGGRDALSAGMLTVGALGIVIVPLVAMGMMLVREAGAAEQEIRLWISAGGLQRLPDQVAAVPFIGGWLKSAVSGTSTPTFSLEQSLMAGVKELSQFLIGGMGDLLKNTFALVTNFFIMLLVLFFSLHGWPAVARCPVRFDSDGGIAQVQNSDSVGSNHSGGGERNAGDRDRPRHIGRHGLSRARCAVSDGAHGVDDRVGADTVRRYRVDMGAGGILPVLDGCDRESAHHVGLGNRRRLDGRSDSSALVDRPGCADSCVASCIERVGRVGAVWITRSVCRAHPHQLADNRRTNLSG